MLFERLKGCYCSYWKNSLVGSSRKFSFLLFGLILFFLLLQPAWSEVPTSMNEFLLNEISPKSTNFLSNIGLSKHAEQSDNQDEFDIEKWFSFSANFDASYRNTQFFTSGYDTTGFHGDSRFELWLPPFHEDDFAWGPYLRLAGIASTQSEPWENAWLARPGFGLQVYPFSFPEFRQEDSIVGKIFGPLRIFGEYNKVDYWGTENSWRPDEQMRFGMDYWRTFHTHDLTKPIWGEIWSGLTWQSTDDDDRDYNSTVFGNSIRLGTRIPDANILSMFSPYAIVESSITENKDFWENRLLLGGGIRFTPSLEKLVKPPFDQINRLVIFAEYLNVAAYYKDSADSGIPDYDFRVGIGIGIGKWWQD